MLNEANHHRTVMPDSETNQNTAGPLPEVTIEKLVYGGSGLARVPVGQAVPPVPATGKTARVVLVPFVLPGETVRVAVASEKPGLLEANLAEVIRPAESRVDPSCPFFYRCGGCQYQHIDYAAQVEHKREIVRDTLRRIAKLEAPETIESLAAEPWGYRNRTQFHTDGSSIGYFGFGSRHLVPVDRCPISSPKINDTLAELVRMTNDRRWPRFVRTFEVFTNEKDVQINVRESGQPVARRFFDWCAERIPGFAPGAIEYAAAGERYRVGGGSFFQVNRFLIDPLVERALARGAGVSALDLYAGVGLFSLPLARRFERVAAVESSAAAVRDLKHNAEAAGVSIEVHQASAESFLDELPEAPDFVLADPPRAGLGKFAVRALARLKPRRLTIVSCDPATLARDLAALTAAGYRIERFTVVDLFPQTFHIETVVHLEAA